jgi:hypothetical protein
MACQLTYDCLNDIFEHLEEDKPTLHSCLLVNRLVCEISVRILWRNIWDPENDFPTRPFRVTSSIFSTLVACLPNESKELLYKNEIFIPTPTPKPPLFNYAAFCKVLSIDEIDTMVNLVLEGELSININSLNDKKCLITNEIIKMFANQVSSLKILIYIYRLNHFSFTYFPGARNLSELYCKSNLPSNFFYQLSQVCNSLQSISIEFGVSVSNELKELISLQNNLKNITLILFEAKFASIIPFLTKNSNTITKLHIFCDNDEYLPLSFISLLQNLQEITFSSYFLDMCYFKDFEKLQYTHFPKLQNLNILSGCLKPEYIIKFLENSGNNLKRLYICESDKALSLSISKFCPNLRSLFIKLKNDEIDMLRIIFISCHHLESFMTWCGIGYLTEKEVLKTVANYSPKNFYELRIYNSTNSEFKSPEDLELYFIGWKNRIQNKILNLIINGQTMKRLIDEEENMKIIKKYENLGIIKLRIEKHSIKEMIEVGIGFRSFSSTKFIAG